MDKSNSPDSDSEQKSADETKKQTSGGDKAWLRDEHEQADEQTRTLDEPAEGQKND